MNTLSTCVGDFVRLMRAGKPLEAMHRYYDEEVVVFENRKLARAGRAACLTHEQQELERQPTPPTFQVASWAVQDSSGHAFIEYVIRFWGPDGNALRLEEVAVQKWHRDKITEERFYYEGVIDEGASGED